MNYQIIICLLLFTFPIFVDVYGQQGSRDLMAEYCQNNWIKDPVKCANYLPPDYEANKAKYQAQEAEKAKQEITQSNLATESPRTCPLGSYLGKDTFGNQACLDSKTNQFVSAPNIAHSTSSSGDNVAIIGIMVFIIIIVIIVGVAKSRSKPTAEIQEQHPSRKDFSESIQHAVVTRQNNLCAECGNFTTIWEYDHINGKNWENDISNCQALCPKCHARKSRYSQMGLD